VLDPGEIDLEEGEVVLLGDESRHLRARHCAALDEDLAETPVARDPLLGERPLELPFVHEPVAQEERPERRGAMGPRVLGHGDGWPVLGLRQPGIGVGPVLRALDGKHGRPFLGLGARRVRDRVLDRPVDLVLRGDGVPERHAQQPAELVGEEDERRIRRRDEDGGVRKHADGQRGEPARLLLGEEAGGSQVHVGLGQLDERKLVLLREELGDLHMRDRPALDEELAEAAGGDSMVAGVLLVGEHRLELVGIDEAVAEEERAERRPRVMGGFHVLLIGLPVENLSGENRAVRAVVQRVSTATLSVGGDVRSRCGRGLVVLVGIAEGDGEGEADRLARKVARLRVFEDERGRLDRSVLDVEGEVLVVSQFTLIADTARGTRPSFSSAAAPEDAEPLYERVCESLEREGVRVARGVFGARMEIALVNDGPVTVVLDVSTS